MSYFSFITRRVVSVESLLMYHKPFMTSKYICVSCLNDEARTTTPLIFKVYPNNFKRTFEKERRKTWLSPVYLDESKKESFYEYGSAVADIYEP